MTHTTTETDPPTDPPTADRTFEAFFDTEYVGLVRLAALLCGDAGSAEELVQDALVSVHARWDTLDEPAAYARTCVVNRCRDVARRAGRFRSRQHLLVVADTVNDASASDRADLVAALSRLSEPRRVALVLRYYGGCSDADVAASMGIPLGTAKSHLQRGLDELRKVIEP